jgi:hypothetical protein
MISDEDLKLLFMSGLNILNKYGDRNKPLPTQFHRGVGLYSWENQHPGGCERHMSVFDKFDIIPKYCFDCYKVLIEPRTVVELFKLMVVFEKLELPNDNTRKCIVECREQVLGTYKGLIYCRGLKEGNEILKIAQKMVSEEISGRIPITIKRGCSEYSLAYPEYAKIEPGTATMEYKEEWGKYEDLADQELVVNSRTSANDTYNHPTYTLQDTQIMLAWLIYAATIGDVSYLRISGSTLQPFQKLRRPSPFQPTEED